MGVLTVTNTAISNNTAGFSGGGFLEYGGTITSSNSTLSGNIGQSSGSGGFTSQNVVSPLATAQLTISTTPSPAIPAD